MGQTETHCPHRIQTVGACSRGCSQGARHRRPLVLGSTGASRLFWVTPCHGAAHQDQARLLPEAAGGGDQLLQRRAQGDPQVAGPGYRAPRHRHGPVGRGEAFVQCLAHRKGCRDVEDHTAYVLRPASRRDLPAGDRLDDLFLRPHGVAGADGLQLHPAPLAADAALQRLHGGEHVALRRQHHPVHTQHLGKSAGPLQNGLPPLLEQAQVGSDIGLTLSGVDDQGVHPAPGPEDLHLGGGGDHCPYPRCRRLLSGPSAPPGTPG